jgi:hypothetical protein
VLLGLEACLAQAFPSSSCGAHGDGESWGAGCRGAHCFFFPLPLTFSLVAFLIRITRTVSARDTVRGLTFLGRWKPGVESTPSFPLQNANGGLVLGSPSGSALSRGPRAPGLLVWVWLGSRPLPGPAGGWPGPRPLWASYTWLLLSHCARQRCAFPRQARHMQTGAVIYKLSPRQSAKNHPSPPLAGTYFQHNSSL